MIPKLKFSIPHDQAKFAILLKFQAALRSQHRLPTPKTPKILTFAADLMCPTY